MPAAKTGAATSQPVEVHYVECDAWDGSGGLAVGIDRDGDGGAEESWVLPNTSERLFLSTTVRWETLRGRGRPRPDVL